MGSTMARAFGLMALASLATASPMQCPPSPTPGAMRTITQFPNGTWVENLALRSDGTILVTTFEPSAQLILIDPSKPNGAPQIVHSFDDPKGSLSGIEEIGHDVFYFGKITRGSGLVNSPPGTGKVYRANMSNYHGKQIPVDLVSNLTDSILPNGFTSIPNSSTLLIGDSQRGVVFSVNADSGAYSIVSNDPYLKNTTSTMGLGVNGVHSRAGYLYFTNTDQEIYARYPMDHTGRQIGKVEILDSLKFPGVDDFAFASDNGNAAVLAGDMIDHTVYSPGTGSSCAVNLTQTGGPTATKVQKTKDGKIVVFVVTNGGIAGYEGLEGPSNPSAGKVAVFELKG